jgi:hypothetical protein
MKTWAEINAKKYVEIANSKIQALGLRVGDFVHEADPPLFKIVHLPTGDYFSFGGENGGAKWTRPGHPGKMRQTGRGRAESWETKIKHFDGWLEELKSLLAAIVEDTRDSALPPPAAVAPSGPLDIDKDRTGLSISGPDDIKLLKEGIVRLFPSQEFPKYMHHATQLPVLVNSKEEQAEFGPEWSEVYIHQPYPKHMYTWNEKTISVNNAEEEAALPAGWSDNSGIFKSYVGPRPPKAGDHDPTKWVDECPIPDLSSEHRRKIKAQLLRAHAAFWRSADTPKACAEPMQQAFSGVAKVLADAGILSESLLRNEIPELIWDSAIAGGWYRLASEKPDQIFPEQLGHYWVWRDDELDWKNLFYSEITESIAWLLENPGVGDAGPTPPVSRPPIEPPKAEQRQTNHDAPRDAASPAIANSSKGLDFTSEPGRVNAIAGYTAHWTTAASVCREASLARTARVAPADLSKWKKGRLPATSEKKKRIEDALRNNTPPTPLAKRSAET